MPLTEKPKEAVKPAAETDEQARARAEACGKEVAEVLRKNRCRLIPYLLPPEPAGHTGAKLIIEATYGIIPDLEAKT